MVLRACGEFPDAPGALVSAGTDPEDPAVVLIRPPISNGAVATTPLSATVHAAGLFNGRAAVGANASTAHRARVPSSVAWDVAQVNGTTLCAAALDTAGGAYLRRFAVPHPGGSTVLVTQRFYAHQERRELLIVDAWAEEVVVDSSSSSFSPADDDDGKRSIPPQNITVVFTRVPGSNAVSQDLVLAPAGAAGTGPPDPKRCTVWRVAEGEGAAGASDDAAAGDDDSRGSSRSVRPLVAACSAPPNDDRGLSVNSTAVVLPLQPGSAPTLVAVSAITTDIDGTTATGISPVYQADRAMYGALAMGANALWQEHRGAWEKRMARGVRIGGGGGGGQEMVYNETTTSGPSAAHAAAVLRATDYYVRSVLRADEPYGLSPGGLAGEAYNGHTFWDMDTWVFPGILPFDRKLARSIVAYRTARLPAARGRATDRGFRGAMFPWESALTGIDVTPAPASNTEGELEVHVSADISLAVMQYWQWSGDDDFMATGGQDLVADVADFWVSRCPDRQCLGVQPPDESAGKVNNSVYTNAAAMESVRWAIAATRSPLANAVSRSGMAADHRVEAWQDFVDRGIVLPFDKRRGIHLEYDGYTNATINQNDVGLLQYPLAVPGIPNDVKIRDLAYYATRIDRDGYLTGNAAQAIAYWRLALRDQANAQLNLNWQHVAGPFLVWQERAITRGHLNFLTGAGGFIQSWVQGCMGLTLEGGVGSGHGSPGEWSGQVEWTDSAGSARVFSSANSTAVTSVAPVPSPVAGVTWIALEGLQLPQSNRCVTVNFTVPPDSEISEPSSPDGGWLSISEYAADTTCSGDDGGDSAARPNRTPAPAIAISLHPNFQDPQIIVLDRSPTVLLEVEPAIIRLPEIGARVYLAVGVVDQGGSSSSNGGGGVTKISPAALAGLIGATALVWVGIFILMVVWRRKRRREAEEFEAATGGRRLLGSVN
jgi:hypothetical protein